MVDVWDSMGRTLLALGAVLLLMGAAAWVARRVLSQRIGISGGTPLIQVVANSYLAPRQSIALVAVAGQYFAVGLAADTLIPLGRIEATESLATLISSSGQSGAPCGISSHNLLSAEWWQDVTKAFGQGKQGGPHA
ncbi:MAG: flagellar biosynthetic protein FliO [Nitrospira sp.]|nr:flagellar biosynthetic protein FliO [Nitrospira sp.]